MIDTLQKRFASYPEVCTCREMCEMLGHISLKTGYRLLQKKTIPSFRIGRLRFILKEDILAFMRQQC